MPNTNPAAAPTPDNVSAAFRAMLTFLRLMLGWPQIVDPDVKSDIRALLRVVEAGETEHRRRAALAPAAAPVDYPPAVLEEAKEAACAAASAAWARFDRDDRSGARAAESAGAQAYAAVLARHTVAVRAQQRLDQQLAPAADGVADFPEVSKADAALARLATVEAAVCACAEIGESERPCIFCEADAIATGTDPTPAILTYDDKTAGRFIVQPSGDGPRVYSFGTAAERQALAAVTGTDASPDETTPPGAWQEYARAPATEIARLTAERDRALGQLEQARMHASAAMTGAEALTTALDRMAAERLTLTAERDAWARYARAFVNRTWHGASGTPSSLAAVAELNAACEALRALGIDPGEAAR